MAPPVTEVVRDPRRSGAPICTAHWPDGNPCQRIACRGTTKCSRHGGKSLRGMASPSLKHGRYSKDLPTRLAARAEAALASPRLLSLEDEIAVMQARLGELLSRVDTGESGATWGQVRAALEAFKAASAAGDMAGMNTAFAALDRLVTHGASDVQTWKDIEQTGEALRRLVQTQGKTLVALQQIVTVQQLMTFQKAMTDSVLRAVRAHTDAGSAHKILAAIQADFADLAHRGERR